MAIESFVPRQKKSERLTAEQEKEMARRIHRAGVLAGDWKLLLGVRGPELFHAVRDRGERHNLASTQAATVVSLTAMARQGAGPVRTSPEAPRSSGLLEMLRSLGYVN